MTTDVQNVTICLVGGSTFTINCVFLEGSNTNCIYSLREFGVDISNGTIDRSNSEGDTIMVADIDGSQLLAYASDLTDVGDDLAVRRNITGGSVLPCPVSTTGKPSIIEILYTFLCTSLARSAHYPSHSVQRLELQLLQCQGCWGGVVPQWGCWRGVVGEWRVLFHWRAHWRWVYH